MSFKEFMKADRAQDKKDKVKDTKADVKSDRAEWKKGMTPAQDRKADLKRKKK